MVLRRRAAGEAVPSPERKIRGITLQAVPVAQQWRGKLCCPEDARRYEVHLQDESTLTKEYRLTCTLDLSLEPGAILEHGVGARADG